MTDHFARLRQQALEKETERKRKSAHAPSNDASQLDKQVAAFTGIEDEVVASCCGSICSNCDVFLDKAIALEELGHPHHLFMNRGQEEKFGKALALFREEKEEYQKRRQEIIDSMRR